MQYIEETVLKDLFDIGKDIKDEDGIDTISGYLNRKNKGSIAKRTNNLTAVFPVFCSDSIPIDQAAMVSKAMERKASSLLQMVFAANQISRVSNAEDYLKQFHSNLKISSKITVDNVMDVMDDLSEQMIDIGYIDKHSAQFISEAEIKRLWDLDKGNLNYVLPDSISEESLDIYKISESWDGINVHVIHEKKKNKVNRSQYNSVVQQSLDQQDTIDAQQQEIDSLRQEVDRKEKVIVSLHDKNRSYQDTINYNDKMFNDYKSDTDNRLKNRSNEARASQNKNKELNRRLRASEKNNEELRKQLANNRSNPNNDKIDWKTAESIAKALIVPKLIDSDVKKANELVPTMMQVNVYNIDKETKTVTGLVFIVGVKAKLYALKSNDIITRVISKQKDQNFFLKFIRATTREIAFFRDFLFGIDQAKIDALSQSRKGSSSKIWKILERRALMCKIKNWTSKINDATPISTLVISQAEVEFIKSTEKIDLENSILARRLLESYNLLAFVIVDEVTESCKFIFDSGDDVFEVIPFANLEREASDNAYKKVISLMNKMAR